MHDKLAYLIKHVSWIQWLYRAVMGSAFRFWGLFLPVNDKLVLFSSYGGKQFSDSPKVLFEAMKNDPRFRDYQFIWAAECPDKMQIPGAKVVKTDSRAYFQTALQSKIWITNVNIERGLNFKKKETIYLNTWHGTGPKKGGNAVSGRKDYDFSRVDFFCCDGKYTHDVFMKWWNAREDSMLWCGRPREDALFEYTKERISEIRRSLGIPADRKAILYMPTWREYSHDGIHYEKWIPALGKEYVICARGHHFSKAKIQ